MVGAIGTPDFAAVMGHAARRHAGGEREREAGDRVLSVNGAPVLGITDMNVELFGLAGSADIPVRFSRGDETFVRHFSLAGVSLDDMSGRPPSSISA